MRHGSLFSGIGGFDLAAEWMGWENVFHCEWNKFGQTILKGHWPGAKSYEDIKKTDFTIWRGGVDVLSGGFPCQPYSTAGKRLGKEDERHLWPQMLRAIREISPRWVVGENVRGLTNWNEGVVFDEVQADLEAEGYEVLPFLLPACAVNAPHRRDRIWFIAFKNTNRNGWDGKQREIQSGERKFGDFGTGNNERLRADNEETINASNPNSDGFNGGNGGNEIHPSEGGINALGNISNDFTNESFADTPSDRRNGAGAGIEIKEGRQTEPGTAGQLEGRPERFCNDESFADTSDEGLQGGEQHGAFNKRIGTRQSRQSIAQLYQISNWQNFPTQSPVCDGNDGFSTESLRQRLREDSLGHLSEKEIDKIISEAVSQWRKETIKAGGNAVVPQVVLQIFKAIERYESLI